MSNQFIYNLVETTSIGNDIGKHNFNALSLETAVCNISSKFFNPSSNVFAELTAFLDNSDRLFNYGDVERYNRVSTVVKLLSSYWKKTEFSVQYPINISLQGNLNIDAPTVDDSLQKLINISKNYLDSKFPAVNYPTGSIVNVCIPLYNHSADPHNPNSLITTDISNELSYYVRTMKVGMTRNDVHFDSSKILKFKQSGSSWALFNVIGSNVPDSLKEPPYFIEIVNISPVTNSGINALKNGSITLRVTGSSGLYRITLNNISKTTSSDAALMTWSNLENTSYDIFVKSANTGVEKIIKLVMGYQSPTTLTFNSVVYQNGSIPMIIEGSQPRHTINLTIPKDTSNYDVSEELKKLDTYVPGLTDVVVTINNGITVSSQTYTLPAISASNLKDGDVVFLFNNGNIIGAGGDGGNGGDSPSVGDTKGYDGKQGGPAIESFSTLVIENNGLIAGGGGGGAGGTGGLTGTNSSGGAGGGGAGKVPGKSGNRGSNPIFKSKGIEVKDGESGGNKLGGFGGEGLYGTVQDSRAVGGRGGALGKPGEDSNTGIGGLAGYYALGHNNITWAVRGNVIGTSI